MKKAGATKNKIINTLFDKKIISFSFEPPYVFSSGIVSPIYIDNQMIISYPNERRRIVNEMIDLIKSKKELKNIDCIASSLSSASSFGILVAEALELPLILVRDKAKIHGKRNRIEGKFAKNANILVIEDHVSTGSALINSVTAIRKEGGKVDYSIAITDYEIGRDALSVEKINVLVLVSGSSILNHAIEKGVLSKMEEKEVKEWFKNPIKWGEERGYYSINVN